MIKPNHEHTNFFEHQSQFHFHSQSHTYSVSITFSPIDHRHFAKQTIPGYVPPLCTIIPASMTHAQPSMHKPHSFHTHRRPFALREKSVPTRRLPKIRASGIKRTKARVTRRPFQSHSQSSKHWAKARTRTARIFCRPRKDFFAGLQINRSWLPLFVDGEVAALSMVLALRTTTDGKALGAGDTSLCWRLLCNGIQ